MLLFGGRGGGGVGKRGHLQRWTKVAGWHQWTPPTQAQIKARMRDRRETA